MSAPYQYSPSRAQAELEPSEGWGLTGSSGGGGFIAKEPFGALRNSFPACPRAFLHHPLPEQLLSLMWRGFLSSSSGILADPQGRILPVARKDQS